MNLKDLRPEARILDVRSPSEFAAGSLPSAINLPILSDEERAAVGLKYRTHGRAAAIALGESLVCGQSKAQRIADWVHLVECYPQTVICCARGGMRSEYAQRWLAEVDLTLGRVEGGYKALRSACLQVVECAPAELRPIILGGRTGSGKTNLLREYASRIDLEGLANHRGSAFGALNKPQPSQASMENALACELTRFRPGQTLLLEDESRAIGSRSLPMPLFQAMSEAPIAVIDLDRETRARRIYTEYVEEASNTLPQGELHKDYRQALERIRKRLGDLNYRKITTQLDDAFKTRTQDAHLVWITSLLTDYYDPMYDYAMKRKAMRIAMRGSPQEVRKWLDDRLAPNPVVSADTVDHP